MYKWIVTLLVCIFLSCGIRRDKKDNQLFVGDINCIVGINPLNFFDKANPDLLLSLSLFRDWLESSSFQFIWSKIIEQPLQAGINFRQPVYLIHTFLEDQSFFYGSWHVSSDTKMESFLQINGFQNIRTFGTYKVIVAEPFAIAWNNSFGIIAPAVYIPDLLLSIEGNKTNNISGNIFIEQTDPNALITLFIRPDYLPTWQENIDRLKLCGLNVHEIKHQFLTAELYDKGNNVNIDIRFHYKNSWASFWTTFFNQKNEKIEKMNSDSFSGSWFSSRLNLILADSIVHSQCPINLLDPYISIPSHKIIRRAISCLDENYAIYLPAYEQSPKNHITIFKTSYPEYLKNILEEELTICLGSSEILSDTSFNNHTSNTMYYAVRDSMFIVSKNALSIVKSEQDFKWLQQKWYNSPQSNGELVVSVFHIQQLASIPNDIVLTGKLMGNVMENRLILQFKKADKDPNGLTSMLHLLNYLYTYNNTFYDWLDKPKDDVIL